MEWGVLMSYSSTGRGERRSQYRVHYLRGVRPRLHVAGKEFEVREGSPNGLRVMVSEDDRLLEGGEVEGVFRFAGGRSYGVRGEWKRASDEEVVFHLVKGLPEEEFNRRKFFRVKYPEPLRPILRVFDRKLSIVDICEAGISFLPEGADWGEILGMYELDQEIRGTLRFHDGEAVEVDAVICRIDRDRIACHFQDTLPLDRVMAEQRFVNQIFGGHSIEALLLYFREAIEAVGVRFNMDSHGEEEDRIRELSLIGNRRGLDLDVADLHLQVSELVDPDRFCRDRALELSFDILRWRFEMTGG